MAPFYEYRCEDCHAEREEFHSMKAEPEFKCDKCQSLKPLKRQIAGAPGFSLKGAGWSQDGYSVVSHPRFNKPGR